MKLFEEFKLVENMWDSLDVAEADETVDIFENLKAALIDSFSAKGYREEVEILEKCSIRSSFDLPWGGKDTIVMLTTDNKLYIHPELAKPENFDKASLAVRIELAYLILGIRMTPDKRDFASVRSAVAAIRARLTKEEIRLAKNFVVDGKQYIPLRFYNKYEANVAGGGADRVGAGAEENPLKEAANNKTSIRCMHAIYEDDDGYVCNVSVRSDDLSEDEVETLLYESGMMGVIIWDEHDIEVDAKYAANYKLGDVVQVYDVNKEDIEDVAAILGKDPEDYDDYKHAY